MIYFMLIGCGDKTQDTSTTVAEPEAPVLEAAPEPNEEIDITDIVLDSRSGDCGTYIQTSISNVMDVQRDTAFMGTFTVSLDGENCIFTSNAIPNHDFNEAPAQFATPVSEQSLSFTLSQNPSYDLLQRNRLSNHHSYCPPHHKFQPQRGELEDFGHHNHQQETYDQTE